MRTLAERWRKGPRNDGITQFSGRRTKGREKKSEGVKAKTRKRQLNSRCHPSLSGSPWLVTQSWDHAHTGQEALSHLWHLFPHTFVLQSSLVFINLSHCRDSLQSYWTHIYIMTLSTSPSSSTPPPSDTLVAPLHRLPSSACSTGSVLQTSSPQRVTSSPWRFQCCSSPPPPHAPGNVKSLVKTSFSPFHPFLPLQLTSKGNVCHLLFHLHSFSAPPHSSF